MLIQLVNEAGLNPVEVERVRTALNVQLGQFFAHWDIGGSLITEPGDATLYLVEHIDVDGALGYHDVSRGKAIGFVDLTLAEELGEPWTVTASHEMLELIADPLCNLLVMGPHPTQRRNVMYWYEMCDACQGDSYGIWIAEPETSTPVQVSDFLLPHYFTVAAEEDFQNDYLGLPLKSFAIRPGGYVGFWDPLLRRYDQAFGDDNGRERWEIKASHFGRRDFIRSWSL